MLEPVVTRPYHRVATLSLIRRSPPNPFALDGTSMPQTTRSHRVKETTAANLHHLQPVQQHALPKWTSVFRLTPRPVRLILAIFVFLCFSAATNDSLVASRLHAADFSDARALFFSGQYDECIELTRSEVDQGIWNDFWARQLITTLLVKGQYEEALAAYESVSKKFANSIPLRVLGAESLRFCGRSAEGQKLLDEIVDLVNDSPWRYSDRENLIAIGKHLLTIGEDARLILNSCYDRILKGDPNYVDAYIAIAELALSKADYQEAVSSLDRALELRPEDPQISYLLSKAWASSDGEKAATYLNAALDRNPKHVESLFLKAQELSDSEQYAAAEEVLEEVFAINPHHPKSWALKAAIAHLRGQFLKEGEYRTRGLKLWNTNPEVDFIAGETLSKHYRFEEGVKYHRRALKLEPSFLPARFQLAQDLLRVGKDAEGWEIVDSVAEADKYNVVAFNLRTLHDQIRQFDTIEVPGFIVRMDRREANIYSSRVVDLLQQARKVLADKYQVELKRPTTVEIFPQQSDFAIRTFGLPGGDGFLGVCFGSLITANSPASQGETPSNWESVLWHEFCHVVTLQKTNNRMPRWLSEGISVYEELERDATWGQTMTPRYKQMIEGEEFVPLSKLSSAFLRPKSGLHLQFAYYESSLAVRYLIERHGLPLMLKLLDDLGMGVPMQEAFDRRYGDREALDKDFEAFARGLAKNFLPDTDFSTEDVPERPTASDLKEWLREHPNHYFAQLQLVRSLITTESWDQALAEATKLEALYPEDAQPGGSLDSLATIARAIDNRDLELEYLQKIAVISSDNLPALTRLIELTAENGEWQQVEKYAEKLLAVQPLLPNGHEAMVRASYSEDAEASRRSAVASLRALQEMDPLDPAKLHYQMSEKLYESDQLTDARIEALRALEFTPRYREAQKLLVNIRAKLDGLDPPHPMRMEPSPWAEPEGEDLSPSALPPPVVNPPMLGAMPPGVGTTD